MTRHRARHQRGRIPPACVGRSVPRWRVPCSPSCPEMRAPWSAQCSFASCAGSPGVGSWAPSPTAPRPPSRSGCLTALPGSRPPPPSPPLSGCLHGQNPRVQQGPQLHGRASDAGSAHLRAKARRGRDPPGGRGLRAGPVRRRQRIGPLRGGADQPGPADLLMKRRVQQPADGLAQGPAPDNLSVCAHGARWCAACTDPGTPCSEGRCATGLRHAPKPFLHSKLKYPSWLPCGDTVPEIVRNQSDTLPLSACRRTTTREPR